MTKAWVNDKCTGYYGPANIGDLNTAKLKKKNAKVEILILSGFS